ncbi:MAG TPA: PSD1 and planctomycete cytochrome C domain-containing protein, partial [Terriglobia bacterium]|nr:PSD1 and planctomycete cytochrome C domain-containing protein [Terriglobia bacterium]
MEYQILARRTFGSRWVLVPFILLQLVLPSVAQSSDDAAVSILQRKCLQCHGETLQMSGLDVRTREGLLKGGDKGPAIVPGNAEASRAYRRVAGMEQPLMPMAPLPSLSSEEVAILKVWISQGAKWELGKAAQSSTAPTARLDPKPQDKTSAASGYGKTYEERPVTDQERKWWAFQKPLRPSIPKMADARWSSHLIDAFVKKTLDEKGLAPAPQADRNTLVRRATLDLTGLLPTPQEVEAFVNDPSPSAYENLIERLLSSPRYGERWGRFWLDVVRYADSSGFEHDKDLANAWRYRDYVIKAFNQDKPFDRFILEQLAGDELEDRNFDSLTATSYYRIGPRVRFREKDNPYYRYEYLDDVIRTTFQGFMGLSVNCARCHDHKFDPISRKDYYRTMAMFFGYVDIDHPLAPTNQVAEYERIKKEVDEQTRPLRRKIAQIEAPYRRAAFEKKLAKFPEEIQIAVKTPDAQRTPGQKLLAAQIVSLDVDPDAAANQLVNYRSMMKVSDADHELRQKLVNQIEEIQKRLPDPLPVAEGIRDGDYRLTPDGPGDEPLPGKGDRFDYGVQCCFLPVPGKPFVVPPVYFGANGMDVAEDQKSFIVEPGYLKVLAAGSSPRIADAPGNGYLSSGRRRALAEWIASPDNPLTARVMVNRVWHWHFGRGIVPTPGNFGKMGMPPSHPELLDWLATEFVRQKWSLKQMHRLVMTSETYKMASTFAPATNLEKDPTNVALWRFPLRRLEGE